jgi:hypothetical protein
MSEDTFRRSIILLERKFRIFHQAVDHKLRKLLAVLSDPFADEVSLDAVWAKSQTKG